MILIATVGEQRMKKKHTQKTDDCRTINRTQA